MLIEGVMAKSKSKKLPKFASLDKLVEFFETNDASEYWDEMPEVLFDISIKKKTHLVAIDNDLAKEISEICAVEEGHFREVNQFLDKGQTLKSQLSLCRY